MSIKDCPFCGATPTQKAPGLNYQHPDNDCFYGPSAISLSMVDQWNRRVTPAVASVEAGRWTGVPALVDQITAEEGAAVTFVCPNPDFNGLPNECVTIVRGPTWQEETFRADTLANGLRLALIAKGKDQA